MSARATRLTLSVGFMVAVSSSLSFSFFAVLMVLSSYALLLATREVQCGIGRGGLLGVASRRGSGTLDCCGVPLCGGVPMLGVRFGSMSECAGGMAVGV